MLKSSSAFLSQYWGHCIMYQYIAFHMCAGVQVLMPVLQAVSSSEPSPQSPPFHYCDFKWVSKWSELLLLCEQRRVVGSHQRNTYEASFMLPSGSRLFAIAHYMLKCLFFKHNVHLHLNLLWNLFLALNLIVWWWWCSSFLDSWGHFCFS